jgi:hypothetical protein
VFQTHVSSVLSVFFCMLQVLYLNVLKVDWLLHMRYVWEAGKGASSPHAMSGGASDIARSLHGHCSTLAARIRRPGASKSVNK